MALEKIVVVNFQKHEREEFVLDPLVTVFTGPNDAGKSALLRCLRWLATNYPSGVSFIRKGTDFSECILFVDGQTCTRYRSRSDNSYQLGAGQFQKVGTEVPAGVAKLLNVGNVNFQDQHDPPFWLNLTGGQLARELNAVVDLTLIDSTLANLASWVRREKTQLDLHRESLKDARGKRDTLAWVLQANTELAEIERLSTSIAKTRQECARINDQLQEGERLAQRKKTLLRARTALQSLLVQAKRVLDYRVELADVENAIRRYTKLQETRCELQEKLAQIRQRIAKGTKGRCPLCGQPIRSPL
jgi:hypothetical protein